MGLTGFQRMRREKAAKEEQIIDQPIFIFSKLLKPELLKLAKEKEIPYADEMTKKELVEALEA